MIINIKNVENITITERQPKISKVDYPPSLKAKIQTHCHDRLNYWGNQHILHGLKPNLTSILMMSNDYLSLAHERHVLDAQINAIKEYGNGSLMSSIFYAEDSQQSKFEKRLANFMGYDAGIINQSGYVANLALLQVIADEDMPVYIDIMAHMSLREGIKISGANAINFLHNNCQHLERQIKKHGRGIVIVDSVYSNNGSLCPLVDIVDIANKYNCIIIVDESHSLGTHGENGRGLVWQYGLHHQVHFVTASLAKTFANRGGFIACIQEFKQYFVMKAYSIIFSSALLPSEIASLNACLDLIQIFDERREILHTNANYFRNNLSSIGYNVSRGTEQIISIESGEELNTIILRDALHRHNIFGSVFCYPATPKNQSMIRLTLNSSINLSEIDYVLNAFSEIRKEIDMSSWKFIEL